MRWPWQQRSDPDHSTRLPDGRLSDHDRVRLPGQQPWADLLDEQPVAQNSYGNSPWWPPEKPFHPAAQPALAESTQPLPCLGPLMTPGQQWRSAGGSR